MLPVQVGHGASVEVPSPVFVITSGNTSGQNDNKQFTLQAVTNNTETAVKKEATDTGTPSGSRILQIMKGTDGSSHFAVGNEAVNVGEELVVFVDNIQEEEVIESQEVQENDTPRTVPKTQETTTVTTRT